LKTPSRIEIESAFARVHTSPKGVSLLETIQWSHWSRWEPRLAEVLVQHIFNNWQSWNPMAINEILKLQEVPQSFLVLSEHLALMVVGPQRKIYKLWMSCLSHAIEPVSYQAFYFVNKFAGTRLRRESEQNLKPFSRWGFYCSYLMLNKENQRPRTTMTKASRNLILQDLIQEKNIFSVQDYIDRLNHKIHHRQAERDLKACLEIKAQGQTRNRVYRVI
jgi:hypothetical protein